MIAVGRGICLAVLFFFPPVTAFPVTVRVPEDTPTIQGGIDVAEHGDTVLVAAGTYRGPGNRDIDFSGKEIVVRSDRGAVLTVIDCEGDSLEPHRGFVFRNGEGPAAVLRGFTITGGWAYTGGAVSCDWKTAPTIRDNVIVGNSSYWSGGGISCYAAAPLIRNNTIEENDGGWAGGGIFCDWNSSPHIVNNRIRKNTAYGGGGILCWYNAAALIERNRIIGNRSSFGAGIGCSRSSPVVAGNTIAANQADQYGGGLACDNAGPDLYANTIAGNRAFWAGGGISLHTGSSVAGTGTILRENQAVFEDEVYLADSSTVDLSYCNVSGGWGGEGNIDEDPLFLYPGRGDFRLRWLSPCIDTGFPDSLDADGTRSDMGAWSYDQGEHVTVYCTPGKRELEPGSHMHITVTFINRWESPETVTPSSWIRMPGGEVLPIPHTGPFTLPPGCTVRTDVDRELPPAAPSGRYDYLLVVEPVPPSPPGADHVFFTVSPTGSVR